MQLRAQLIAGIIVASQPVWEWEERADRGRPELPATQNMTVMPIFPGQSAGRGLPWSLSVNANAASFLGDLPDERPAFEIFLLCRKTVGDRARVAC